MSATLSPPAAPAYAVKFWVDDHAVYAELPLSKGEGTYIASFPLSEGGLAKALNFMKQVHAAAGPQTYTHLAQQPAIRRFANFTEAQRDQAQAVLRRLKIIGGGVN